VFDLKLIDRAKVKATSTPAGTPALRPINVKGRKYFVMFLHPYQVFQLRTSAAPGQWQDIQKAAMAGGDVEDNPIFTGALGVYNGVVLHEAQRVTNGVHSTTNAPLANVRRAVLCGAQTGAIAFGQGHSFEKFDWVEELDDYENQLGVGGGAIFGVKKLRFNNMDHGAVVVPTYAADPA
jgi:N4-gp56 family major capsid protein